MGAFKEFRTFILRGNVVDLAVGVIIGTAFNAVVQALVKDIFTPAIGLVFNFHFVGLDYHKGSTPYIFFGDFLNTIVTFLIVAAVVFFVVVKPLNMLALRQAAKIPTPDPTTKTCPFCVSEIPLTAVRCGFCTSELPATESPATTA
jgi:large conductance mechanosensitive channel